MLESNRSTLTARNVLRRTASLSSTISLSMFLAAAELLLSTSNETRFLADSSLRIRVANEFVYSFNVLTMVAGSFIFVTGSKETSRVRDRLRFLALLSSSMLSVALIVSIKPASDIFV